MLVQNKKDNSDDNCNFLFKNKKKKYMTEDVMLHSFPVYGIYVYTTYIRGGKDGLRLIQGGATGGRR